MPLKQCKQCKKDFYSTRHDAQFCSAKCRVTHNRVTDNVTDKSVTDNVTDNKKSVETDNSPNLKDYTAQELYGAIDDYPQDTWIDSPEFVELKKRLKKKDIKTLKEEGYYVPNWKKINDK